MEEVKDPMPFYDEDAFQKGLLKYHTKLKKGDAAKYVLLPGDPKRVRYIAEFLNNVELKADYREYVTATGKYKNVDVSVTSTGIGGPSASIAVEELIEVGADTFIRVGTAGGLSLKVKPNDLAIAQAAIRDEGTSKEYIPIEYPAIADYKLLSILDAKAEELGMRYRMGICRSHDTMYGDRNPELYDKWSRTPALASDMETATVLTVASLRGMHAASVLNIVSPFKDDVPASVGRYAGNESLAMIGEKNEIILALEALSAIGKGGRNVR